MQSKILIGAMVLGLACGTALAASPYPPSSKVEQVTFDFTTVFQHGQGSDQWPMSWASDGNVYAVGGDGNGWEGSVYNYMNVTRIQGSPLSLSGTDVWERSDRNRKPNGIIADAGGKMHIFYGTDSDGWDGSWGMSSSDNGTTWTDTGIKVFSFGADGVLVVGLAQFGPGYTGLPSGVDPGFFYVYLAGRWTGNDGLGKDVYLGRVPKASIFTRSAYTYFNGLDGSGNPIWSSSWTTKKAIFSDPNGMAYHVNVSYNPGLGRYIYAKGHSTSHLALFEGPNLWGPWGTIYYGQFKDSFWKFTYQFPQKWMSADGKTLWMSWSGWPEYDNVNFVKATLTLKVTDITAPTAPSGLAATAAAGPAVYLTWTAATDIESGISGYKVYRKTGAGGTYALVATLGNVTSYADTSVGPLTTYFYQVSAVNGAGLEGPKSNETSATTPDGPPAAPTGLAATTVSPSQIGLTWTDNANNETGFKIERAQGAGTLTVTLKTYNGTNTLPSVQAAGPANSFQVGALVVNDRPDTWTSVPAALAGKARLLTARDDRGQAPVASKYVVTVSGPCSIYLPLDPRYGGAKLSWMDAAWTDSGLTCNSSASSNWKIWKKSVAAAGDVTLGCDTLEVDGVCYVFESGPAFAEIALVGANLTSYADTGLTANTTYTYRVRATNAGGDSGYSNEASATTSAGPLNQPPVIGVPPSAAPNPVLLPGGTTVSVTASDPDVGPQPLTYTWSKVSGPGTVSFTPNGTTASDSSAAAFSAAGAYTLRVTVSDGAATASGDVDVTVNAPPDTQAPSVPLNLAGAPVKSSGAALSWSASTDNVGVAGYRVYRDGLAIATASATSYTDGGLAPATAYAYQISALDAAGNESALSAAVSVTTGAAPALAALSVSPASATVTAEQTRQFSASGTDQYGDPFAAAPAWSVSGGGTIGAAGLFSATTTGGPFTVTALSGAVSGTASVTVVAAPVDLITNIAASNGKVYLKDLLAVGKLCYIDRTYTFTSVPAAYLNQEYIRTANDDKLAANSNFLTFNLTASANVFVAFDSRATSLPAWLGDGTWTLTPDTLGTGDVPRKLHRKNFPAGAVTLGGNAMAPMAGADSMYNVVAIASGPPVNQAPSVSAGIGQTIAFPSSVALDGTVSDDGLPNPPGAVTAAWSALSGPGTVAFGNASAVDTTASFSTTGAYVLRLTASDGALSASDDVNITVQPPNQAPVIQSAPWATPNPVTLPSTTAVSVLASDPDAGPQPLAYTWSKVLGPGTVSFSPNGTSTSDASTATFSAAGSYVLRVTVSDGVAGVSGDVSVTVNPDPNPVFTVTIQSVSTGKAYVTATAQTGAAQYIDRAYTLSALSAGVSGGVLVRTANDDKLVSVAAHLTFFVNAPARVYVCYDTRATALPAWLNDGSWALTAESVSTTDVLMRVYSKSVPAGAVTLGGNLQAPAAGAGSNYFVIVKP